MSIERDSSPEEMGIKQGVAESTSAESLRQRMAMLREQIAKKRGEVGQQVKQRVGDEIVELEKIFTEHESTEKAKQELSENIARTETELKEFEQVIEQAKELGLPVEEDAEFMARFQEEKNKFAGLQQRQTELMSRTKEIASNPQVMGKMQEEAQKEYTEHRAKGYREKSDEYERQYKEKKAEAEAALAVVKEMVSDRLITAADGILKDEGLMKSLGLEGKSRDDLLKLMMDFNKRPDDYNSIEPQIDLLNMVSRVFNWDTNKIQEFRKSGGESNLKGLIDKAFRYLSYDDKYKENANAYLRLSKEADDASLNSARVKTEAR